MMNLGPPFEKVYLAYKDIVKISPLSNKKPQDILAKHMNIVLFSENEAHFFPASDVRTRHICGILKKKEGDTFEAGIEDKAAGSARIIRINKEGLYFEFTPLSDGKALYPVDMIVGFPRPIQLKRLFRDMAGLGVSRILLCGTDLGEKSYMESKIVERGTAYEALRDGSIQAKSTHIPKLEIFPSLQQCLNTVLSETPLYDANAKITVALDNVSADVSLSSYLKSELRSLPPPGKNGIEAETANCKRKIHITAAVGSERGWTEAERTLFRRSGFSLCSMGKRILRTETAATTAAVIILNALGVL